MTNRLHPTFGEKLVGLDFNPSGDEKVIKAKQLSAELADLLYDHYISTQSSEIRNLLYSQAMSKILDAQMNVVKIITLKN